MGRFLTHPRNGMSKSEELLPDRASVLPGDWGVACQMETPHEGEIAVHASSPLHGVRTQIEHLAVLPERGRPRMPAVVRIGPTGDLAGVSP